jgi:hypothetical protein
MLVVVSTLSTLVLLTTAHTIVVEDALEEPAGYELVGHGACLDADGRKYEHWYSDQTLRSLYFRGNASQCGCPECLEICGRHTACVGYSFYCCPEGVRCIAGASVLFGRGERPSSPAPTGFGTKGYYGSPTHGDSFLGVGRIAGVDGDNWDNRLGGWKCYRRSVPALLL